MVSVQYRKWLELSATNTTAEDTLIAVSVTATDCGIIGTVSESDFDEFIAQVGEDFLCEENVSNHPFYAARGIQARELWWLLPSSRHGCNGHGLPKYKHYSGVIFNIAYWTPATHVFKNPWCQTWESSDWDSKGIPNELRYLERRKAANLDLPVILTPAQYNRS